MINLAPFVQQGTGIWWSQISAEPTPLVHALLDQAPALGPVRAFCGLSWDQRVTANLPREIHLISYGALGSLRNLTAAGRLDIVPCNYSALSTLFRSGQLPNDIGLVQVSPPDADGYCTLGVGVDYAADAIRWTSVLIAEMNAQMPATTGGPRIPLSRFAAVVKTDRPLVEAPVRPVPFDATDLTIARYVASLVEDGDTIQIGVGTLPAAVLRALEGHADLGVHSGIISDSIADLIEKGVITGRRKEIDAGRVVTGAAIGTAGLYRRIPILPIDFRPASYTHAPAVLSRLRNLVTINSAIEVDLTGQVGAEVRNGIYVGAIGGQSEFSHSASVTGARSIIALRSKSRGESAIRRHLRGPVTTARADVDVVVTEHGIAHLRGATMAQRAARLAQIAAPEYRDDPEMHSLQ